MKKLKKFRFTATKIIEAKNLDEARDIFCDDAVDFASDADVEELDDELD